MGERRRSRNRGVQPEFRSCASSLTHGPAALCSMRGQSAMETVLFRTGLVQGDGINVPSRHTPRRNEAACQFWPLLSSSSGDTCQAEYRPVSQVSAQVATSRMRAWRNGYLSIPRPCSGARCRLRLLAPSAWQSRLTSNFRAPESRSMSTAASQARSQAAVPRSAAGDNPKPRSLGVAGEPAAGHVPDHSRSFLPSLP